MTINSFSDQQLKKIYSHLSVSIYYETVIEYNINIKIIIF